MHTCVYTHGHIDHVFGIEEFDAEAKTKGFKRPRVIAHSALPKVGIMMCSSTHTPHHSKTTLLTIHLSVR